MYILHPDMILGDFFFELNLCFIQGGHYTKQEHTYTVLDWLSGFIYVHKCL